MEWRNLLVGSALGWVLGWLSHVAQVRWAESRTERSLRHNLGTRVSAFVADLKALWRDVKRNHKEDLEAGADKLAEQVIGIQQALEQVTVVRDRKFQDWATRWFLDAREIPTDLRLFADGKPSGHKSPEESAREWARNTVGKAERG